MSLGLVVFEEKMFTRTPTLQSDDIMSADIKNGPKMNGQKNGQTNRQNFTNFERNLAMMVIYLPVKFELVKPF